ncbi:MAG: hypothetical protein K6E93_01200 [Bacteroidales bacterium]|nr:hypothetical protein [Bacteroidales bacterium]
MNNWIIPSNSGKFDLAKFLSLHDNIVDWKQSANFEVGDVVYIYSTKPEMRIRYKMEVVKTHIPFSKSLSDDGKCWNDKTEFKAGVENNKYFRMRLLSTTQSEMLTMEMLHKQGMKGYIMGPRTINKYLIKYIESNIK